MFDVDFILLILYLVICVYLTINFIHENNTTMKTDYDEIFSVIWMFWEDKLQEIRKSILNRQHSEYYYFFFSLVFYFKLKLFFFVWFLRYDVDSTQKCLSWINVALSFFSVVVSLWLQFFFHAIFVKLLYNVVNLKYFNLVDILVMV